MSDVIVLGAGPAGLMAALQAARAGHECTVCEASPVVGGMAGSFEVAGLRVDYGSHRLHPAAPPDVLSVLGDLLGDDLQVRPRAGRLRLADRWVRFPLRAGDLLRTLPRPLTARLALDAMRSSVTSLLPARRRTFDQEIRARLGPTVADELYGPYARKLYGTGPEDLDAELARRRVSIGSPVDVARRLARAERTAGRTFLYPRRGYGQIAERLAEAAVEAGATVNLSTPVGRVRVGDDRVTVTAGNRFLDGGTVLSTIPLERLAAMVEPPPPPRVVEALAEARTRAMVLSYVVLDRPRYSPFDAHYVPQLDVGLARLSEPKNYRDGDDPSDLTVLCAEIPCWTTDEVWTWSADDLAAMVVDELARIGLPAPGPIGAEVRRLESVYPVYDLAGAPGRALIDGWVRSVTGRLVTLGRQGLRVIDNLHHVTAMGAAASVSITSDGTIDSGRWHRHLDDFALHTVED